MGRAPQTISAAGSHMSEHMFRHLLLQSSDLSDPPNMKLANASLDALHRKFATESPALRQRLKTNGCAMLPRSARKIRPNNNGTPGPQSWVCVCVKFARTVIGHGYRPLTTHCFATLVNVCQTFSNFGKCRHTCPWFWPVLAAYTCALLQTCFGQCFSGRVSDFGAFVSRPVGRCGGSLCRVIFADSPPPPPTVC